MPQMKGNSMVDRRLSYWVGEDDVFQPHNKANSAKGEHQIMSQSGADDETDTDGSTAWGDKDDKSWIRPESTDVDIGNRPSALLFAIRKKREESTYVIEPADLKALVHTELPSSQMRRLTLCEQQPGYSRFSKVVSTVNMIASYFNTRKRTQSSHNNQGEPISLDKIVLDDLADTIVHKNEILGENKQTNKSFVQRMKEMSAFHWLEGTLHNRIVIRKSSRLEKQEADVLTFEDRLKLDNEAVPSKSLCKVWRAALEASETHGVIYYLKQFVRGCRSVFEGVTDVWYRLNFWSQQFREIEGHFGIATSTYFRFTRWLVNLNFVVFFLYLCFIYIPQLSYNSLYEFLSPNNITSTGDFYDTMVRCSKTYTEKAHNKSTNRNWLTFLNIAQGTGFLENTMLFYGYYTNLTFTIAGEKRPNDMRYNMGLGYLLTVGFSFIVVFIMIVKNSSTTIKETVIDFDNKIFPMYTNSTFGGWDYCINSEKMAIYKQRIIYNEFKATLLEVKLKRVRDNRTTKEKSRLYLKRFVINLVVLALLAGAFYAIYVTTDFLIRNQTENLSDILFLLINYLPSIVISMLNAVIPEIFLALSTVEQYSNSFSTHITIVRAVFLRLSSVWVLIVSLYYRLQYQGRNPFNCPEENKYNVTRCCGNALWESIIENDQLERGTVQCWESYVGQQFYKLCITDFISVTLIVLAIKIPRRIIHHHFQHKFWIVKKFGRSKFDLPLQVLDIVYSQTVCWMGMFFTPLLPALTFIKVFYFFFLKKFELLSVAEAPQIAYRASRSYSFFQTVLLLSFIVISCLLGYMIGNLHPSMSCGPFRIYSKPNFVMFDVITNEINSWPSVPQGIIKYFGTIGFYVPAFLIALLSIYYYLAVTAGYKKMEELLKEQLKLEAHDKQFLLARVDEIIKRGQLEAPQIVTK